MKNKTNYYPKIDDKFLRKTIEKIAKEVWENSSFKNWIVYPEPMLTMNDFENLNNGTMDERLKNVNLIKELDYTFVDVEKQLIEDEKHYGDTWKERGLVYRDQSQETRFFQKIEEYFNDYNENGTPMPWKKIIGEAHIALVREKKLSE